MAVTDQLGAVFCVDPDRALYVARTQIEAYAGLAEAFQRVPTVAGPPLDLVALQRLREVLALATGGPSPEGGHVLTPDEARILDLLYEQSALRARLPLRLHRTCTACGRKKIINPARPKATTAEKAGDVANAIVGFANFAADPLGGFLQIMGGMGSKHTTTVLCDYCEGFEFDLPAVTFCPSCKALRTESVLVTCPDCQAAFTAPDAKPTWSPLASVRDVARLTELRLLVDAACAKLAGGVYAEQKQALLDSLVATDETRCLFRSSRPGDSTRSTVALATVRQLVFVKETIAGKATADEIAWADVTAVRHFVVLKAGRDSTIQLESLTGPPLSFTRIGEVSQNLVQPGTLDPGAIAWELARLAGVTVQDTPAPIPVPAQLSMPQASALNASATPMPGPQVSGPQPSAPPVSGSQPSAPQGAAVPVPASLAVETTPAAAGVARPAEPPGAASTAESPPSAGPPRPPSEQAGWYPDPWQQARIRWWDGNAWTSHLRS